MATLPIDEGDEPYHSSSDEDFDVSTAAAAAERDNSSSNGDDDDDDDDDDDGGRRDANTRPKKRRKVLSGKDVVDSGVKFDNEEADEQGGEFVTDIGELDSGDEATIRRGERKREREKAKARKKGKGKKAGGGGGEDEDEEDWDGDESGGEGGFVRTRGMRLKEKVESKRLVNSVASNIDVDALWAQMNSPAFADPSLSPRRQPDATSEENSITAAANADPSTRPTTTTTTSSKTRYSEEMITIKRAIRFAGQAITETKTVPASSAEAKLWLEQQADLKFKSKDKGKGKDRDNGTGNKSPSPTLLIKLRRPLSRLSAFDPNPPNTYPRAFSTAKTHATATTKLTQVNEGTKVNTVDKSKLDWARYVDEQGIQEELVKGSRAKGAYLGRREFLDQVEKRRDDEAREARLARMG